jgi:hypothetical protein
MDNGRTQVLPGWIDELLLSLPPVGAGLALPNLPFLALPRLALPSLALPLLALPPCLAGASGGFGNGGGSGKPDPYRRRCRLPAQAV